MPEVWQADPSSGEPGREGGGELHPGGAGWWEELACVDSEESDRSWSVRRHILQASVNISGGSLDEGSDRVLACLQGACALVTEDRTLRLRAGEVLRLPGVEAAELRPEPGAQVLEVSAAAGEVVASVEILELGTRELREALRGEGTSDALLFVFRGEIGARVSDEDEPFVLGTGASLWIRELVGGEEIWLHGLTDEAAFALLRL